MPIPCLSTGPLCLLVTLGSPAIFSPQLAPKWTATELPVQQEYTAALQKCVLRAEGVDKQLAKGRGAAQPSWDFAAIQESVSS